MSGIVLNIGAINTAGILNTQEGEGLVNVNCGQLGSAIYGSLCLTPVAGTTAALTLGAGNSYLFYLCAVGNNVSYVLGNLHRKISVSFRCLPDPANSSKAYAIVMTPAGVPPTYPGGILTRGPHLHHHWQESACPEATPATPVDLMLVDLDASVDPVVNIIFGGQKYPHDPCDLLEKFSTLEAGILNDPNDAAKGWKVVPLTAFDALRAAVNLPGLPGAKCAFILERLNEIMPTIPAFAKISEMIAKAKADADKPKK